IKKGIGSKNGNSPAEQMTPSEMLKDPRVAIVRVDGMIPAGARKGQQFDVAVSALDVGQNNTSSLAGGTLYRADLFINGANPRDPGKVIDVQGVCQGDIFVNPEYALRDPNDPGVKQSLRFGVIPGGGVVLKDRGIIFRSRAPQASMTRAIEGRVDQFFSDRSVAAALDEGVVQMFLPPSFRGDWEHFVGVTTHLFFNASAEFAARKAKELADEAVKPDAPLMDISYCWEGLGAYGMSYVIPLMTHPSPDVAYAASRAAAYNGDSTAITVLGDMARTPNHPFQISAVQILGSLPTSPVVNQMLRQLLDAPDAVVRIEAYRVLADSKDASIYSQVINNKFILDIIPSKGPPMIYASRRGGQRLAIFGNKPALEMPAAFSALNKRLSITTDQGERAGKNL
ncbi:MAG: flagellar basal body P-ring protein FlgI, partial [Anaerolineae bacterium]|nr:flagellar basal body P-ring protein FlgI [Phycisphaerae bacterium]